jgi:hypothetical protein
MPGMITHGPEVLSSSEINFALAAREPHPHMRQLAQPPCKETGQARWARGRTTYEICRTVSKLIPMLCP